MEAYSGRDFLWWAIPGVLAGMPMPFIHPNRRLAGGGALNDHDDELPLLYVVGIRAVVSLLNLPTDATVYGNAGFQFLCSPIPDGWPPTVDQALSFVRFVNQQRSENRPVAVHCEAGLGRTGTMLASYLIAEGVTAAQAIARIRSVEPSAIETLHQIRFLEDFSNLSRTA